MTISRPPHPVRLAARLLDIAALLAAATILAVIAALIHLADARGPYEQEMGAEGDAGVVANLIWTLTYELAVALAVAVTGVFLARKIRVPSGAAQMASRVVAGVAVLAIGCGMAGDPGVLAAPPGSSAAALRLQAHLVPGWYGAVTTLLSLLLLGLLLAQAVLLFRPAAQDFYHLGAWEEVAAPQR